jgi:hypothetical protein
MQGVVLIEERCKMDNPREIERFARSALLAGLLQAAILVFMGLGQWRMGAGAMVPLGSAVLMATLALSLRRYSRIGAVGLLVFFILGRTLLWGGLSWSMDLVGAVQLGLSLVFLYTFARGVQATFAHQTLTRRYDSWQREAEDDLDPRIFEQ